MVIEECTRTSNPKLITLFHQLQSSLLQKSKRLDSSKANSKRENNDIGVDVNETKEEVLYDGRSILANFMQEAGEPLTWIETIELWNDLLQTNNSSFPKLEDCVHSLLTHSEGHNSVHSLSHSEHRIVINSAFPISTGIFDKNDKADASKTTQDNATTFPTISEKEPSNDGELDDEDFLKQEHKEKKNENEVEELLPPVLVTKEDKIYAFLEEGNAKNTPNSSEDLVRLARGIKDIYGIRLSNDTSEVKFIAFALLFLWLIVIILVVVAQFCQSKSIGSLTWQVLVEAIVLFLAEIVWECVLSALVLKYNIKINYTRKLGNLFKIPKYFAADLLPFYESTAISLVTALAINQTLFCIMYSRQAREKVPFFTYVFLSQDRREDRPDTLIFQVTEDIMRFGIYFPFKILVANRIGLPELVFIPVIVNNIGDGLAEPVGVAFGKHKYSTTALYHKGKFFKSKFTRSYEGSSCVYITTLVVLALYYKSFETPFRFWITIIILPFLMTIAEAKAPHTNDGPFLALVGCSFLSAVFLL
jgi:hypothetical protein